MIKKKIKIKRSYKNKEKLKGIKIIYNNILLFFYNTKIIK